MMQSTSRNVCDHLMIKAWPLFKDKLVYKKIAYAAFVLLLQLALMNSAQAKVALGGSIISNQAKIQYFDAAIGNLTQTSNTVTVTVETVEKVLLQFPQTVSRAPGSFAALPYRVTNTGNVTSTYKLSFVNVATGDNYDLTGMTLFHDANGNGTVDPGETALVAGANITLAPGQSYDLVLQGLVAASIPVGQKALIDIAATSIINPTVNSQITDTVLTALGASMFLSKSVSAIEEQQSHTLSYGLTLSNTGTIPAKPGVLIRIDGAANEVKKILIRDTIPPNTTFVDLAPSQGLGLRLYHRANDSIHFYTTSPNLPVDAVAYAFDGINALQNVSGIFRVNINANATGEVLNTGEVFYNDGLVATDLNVKSNQTTTRIIVPAVKPTLNFYSNGTYTKAVNVSSLSSPALYMQANAAECNASPTKIDSFLVILGSKLAGDVEGDAGNTIRQFFIAQETGADTGVFNVVNILTGSNALPITSSPAVLQNAVLSVVKNDTVTATTSGCGNLALSVKLLIDPFGVVYDSGNNLPVAGARVTLIDLATGLPATVFKADGVTPAPNFVITGINGQYEFPAVDPGSYRFVVTPPDGYNFPSKVTFVRLPARNNDAQGSYGNSFAVNLATGPVNIDIPLDSTKAPMLIEKSASRSTVELGDFVDYTVLVKNTGGQLLSDVRVFDSLPAGFAYVRNSMRVNDGKQTIIIPVLPLAEPEGGVGPKLIFHVGSVPILATLKLTYRVKVGVGALQGNGINSAQAVSAQLSATDPGATSNISSALVKVLPGVFSDRGFIVGKVFADCNLSRAQDKGERGVPGVRLYMEDGTYIITDGEGKFSFYNIRSQTHALKLDNSTLPPGATLEVIDFRNGNDAGSRFVDMKAGQLLKANFAIKGCDAGVLEEIASRAKLSQNVSESQNAVNALFRANTEIQVIDEKALPASGVVGKTPVSGAIAGQATGGITTPAATAIKPATKPSGGKTSKAKSKIITTAQVLEPAAKASGPPLSFPFDKYKKSALDNILDVVNFTGAPIPENNTPENQASNQTPEYQAPASQAPASQAEVSAATQNSAAQAEMAANDDAYSPPIDANAALDLDTLLPTLDNSLRILSPSNKQVLGVAQTNVLIKGSTAGILTLRVNGVNIAATRVGKKSVLESTEAQAWEYVGVDLKPGLNTLEAEQRDSLGNVRGHVVAQVTVPGKISRVNIDVPKNGVPADGKTITKVGVTITDADGVIVRARVPVTLQSGTEGWQVHDLDKKEPGVQLFVENGELLLPITSPIEPTDAEILVSAGDIKGRALLKFVPELRPMIAVGIVEGAINLRNLNSKALQPTRAQDGFEQELRRFSATSSNGKATAGARAAVFLKGKVRGDYLLTLAYDSDKVQKDRLFRDIQPDEFYPVYGDDSVKGYDAQSTGALYVRVDRGSSYALYGDFTTQVQSRSGQTATQLSQYNRSLNGGRGHYENKIVSTNAFASRGASRRFTDEFPAKGVSGFYTLSKLDIIPNSEKIEILTRDRNQPAVIIKTEQLTRFTDYEIEALTGRILFRQPIPSLDANFNLNSIRVDYEIDQGGAQFWVYGIDGQVQVTDKIEVGGTYVRDENPQEKFTLKGANVGVKLGEKTLLTAEVAQTDTVTSGKTDAKFDNPNALLNKGRGEAGVKAAYKLNDKTRLKAEAVRSEDVVSNGHRDGALFTVEHNFTPTLIGEAGVRYNKETTSAADNSTLGRANPGEQATARVRLSGEVPNVPKLTVFGEYEQAIPDTDKKMAAVGGEYRVFEQTKLYAKHEFISSLGNQYTLNNFQQRNATVFGIDSEYMKQGHLFSEYRLRDAITGREAEAAIGLRNSWDYAEGVRIHTGFERIASINGNTQESTAVTGALEYTADPDWKGTARLEYRTDGTSDNILNTLGVAYKLDNEWTVLARNAVSLQTNKAGGSKDEDRLQIGAAYRDFETNKWDGLGRYEFRYEADNTGTLATKRMAHIVSTHLNFQPHPDITFAGRYAGKYVLEDSNGINSTSTANLLGGRLDYDFKRDWTMGVNTSVLFNGNFGSRQYALGGEVGYLAMKNLWLSAGYNIFGFKEEELAEQDYTNQGLFLRLRYKFDESLLK
jgi:uncharacterized repeat protein (TIGR01451 family)